MEIWHSGKCRHRNMALWEIQIQKYGIMGNLDTEIWHSGRQTWKYGILGHAKLGFSL